MDKELFDKLISDATKTIFIYCRNRTNSKEEAEDLSQDVLLELLKSHKNLRDDKAFYGFMWAVAGNVYKDWCKKRARLNETEIKEYIPDERQSITELLEKESEMQALYRELSLLSEQSRSVTISYYFDRLKVHEISKSLGISESMVKFLLFKTRKVLREGINMNRTRGNLSFSPGNLQLRFWGKGGRNPFYKLCEDSLIAQNILLACYNDRCTAEDISIQIGVPVPYLEKDLAALCEMGVLVNIAGKYETAVVIFTKDFAVEADERTLIGQMEIAEMIKNYLSGDNLKKIKSIGFHMEADDNLLCWHIATLILEKAVFHKYQGSLDIVYPTKYAGYEAFVWGEEDYKSRYGGFGTCGLKNTEGDLIRFLDFSINGEMDHRYFFDYPNRVNIALDVANSKSEGFSENDLFEISELIKRGFIRKTSDDLILCLPIYTSSQFEQLLSMLDLIMKDVAEKTREMMNVTTELLVQHTPVTMQNEAERIGWLKMFDNAVTAPVKIMLENGTLCQVADNVHPTAYVVLKNARTKPASR